MNSTPLPQSNSQPNLLRRPMPVSRSTAPAEEVGGDLRDLRDLRSSPERMPPPPPSMMTEQHGQQMQLHAKQAAYPNPHDTVYRIHAGAGAPGSPPTKSAHQQQHQQQQHQNQQQHQQQRHSRAASDGTGLLVRGYPEKENRPMVSESETRTDRQRLPSASAGRLGRQDERVRSQAIGAAGASPVIGTNATTKEKPGKLMKEKRRKARSQSRGRPGARMEEQEEEEQRSKEGIDHDFAGLLAEMEIPTALRVKLSSLDSAVKASMLRGQATLNLSSLGLDYGSGNGNGTNTGRGRSKSRTRGASGDDGVYGKGRAPIPKGLRASKSGVNLVHGDGDNDNANANGNGDLESPPNRASIFGERGSGRVVSSGSASSGSDGGAGAGNAKAKRGSVEVINSWVGKTVRSPNLGAGPSSSSFFNVANHPSGAGAGVGNTSSGGHGHSQGTKSRSASIGRDVLLGSGSRADKEGPEAFATMLCATEARRIEVGRVKRMRVILASESPSWLGEFVEMGGYAAMLARLGELLEMEWREEQHDDQLLHELLRCFAALATTDRGKLALQSRAPTPFKELVDLLFSEKKPGDLSTRKQMVELLTIFFELQLPSSSSSSSSSSSLSSSTAAMASPTPTTPRESSALSLLVTLLHNPPDPQIEAVHDFITASHTPRPFKTYLLELAGVCRDYFWIFCHAQNRYWRLEDVDVGQVEGPKVPGGMTGGVEFEAMGYLTTHLRLVNMIASGLLNTTKGKSGEEALAAYNFHVHLFSSGLERIIATLRRASQHYYAPMHLELARYLSLAQRARFLVPADIEVWKAHPSPMLLSSGSTGAPASAPAPVPASPAAPAQVHSPVAARAGPIAQVTSPSPASPRSPRTSPERKSAEQFSSGRWLGGPGAPRAPGSPVKVGMQSPRSLPAPVLAAAPAPAPMTASGPAAAPMAAPPSSPKKLQGILPPPRPVGGSAEPSAAGCASPRSPAPAPAPGPGSPSKGLGLAAINARGYFPYQQQGQPQQQQNQNITSPRPMGNGFAAPSHVSQSQSQQAKVRSPMPPSTISAEMAPPMPARSQDSVVGTAIKQWEQRAGAGAGAGAGAPPTPALGAGTGPHASPRPGFEKRASATGTGVGLGLGWPSRPVASASASGPGSASTTPHSLGNTTALAAPKMPIGTPGAGYEVPNFSFGSKVDLTR